MIVVLITCVLSAVACGAYIRLATRWQVLDVPNERSSHQHPTPRGGGLPLMLAFYAGVLAFFGPQIFYQSPYSFVLGGAVFLTLVGVLDDAWSLSIRLRFVAYGLCCCVVAAGLLHDVTFGSGILLAGSVLVVATALLWVLNLYNFMDGLDGFAASQCFLACSGAAMLVGVGSSEPYVYFCLLLGFSHLGFLLWNWPVARLFMGDAGSISTGFVLAALAVLGAVEEILPLGCWLILLALFITDASYTLCWRMSTGQKFTQAHRLHGYQRLSRYWGSHLPVLYLLIAVNWLWLFPLAWAARTWAEYGVVIVLLAYLPLLLGVVMLRRLD